MSADDEATPEPRRKKKARKSARKKSVAREQPAESPSYEPRKRFTLVGAVGGALFKSRRAQIAFAAAISAAAALLEYQGYGLQQRPWVAILVLLVLLALVGGAISQIIQSKADAPAARPPFAEGWPDDRSLAPLLQAFEAGNFAFVREQAPKVAAQTKDPAIRAAAEELRRRIEPSPTSLYLWLLGVVLVVFLYGYFLSHAH